MPRLIKTRIEIEGRVDYEYTVVEEADERVQPWGPEAELSIVGQGMPRLDGSARTTGSARYTSDIRLPGMLYGATLRSPHPHARIRAIDTSKARRLAGVVEIITHQNIPEISWHGKDGKLLDQTVRFIGDEVAVVAATDLAIAQDALELIEVDYEPLPAVFDPEQAMQEQAPPLHEQGNILNGKPAASDRGDVEQGLAEAAVVVEGTFRTPTALHNCLETHGSVAAWEGDNLTLYDSTQWIWESRKQVAKALKLPTHKVRVIKHYMGGGFGSKIGTGKYAVLAALLARKTGRPVQIMLNRWEENVATGNRPATIIKLKLGARQDGTLTAIDCTSIANLGAYGGWSGGATGPMRSYYSCPNVRTREYGVFTNLGPMSAFRAPGYVEGTFALEALMDELALKLGIDPLALRRINYMERDIQDDREYASKGLAEAYRIGAELVGWERRDRLKSDGRFRRGVGMATQNWGGSGGPPAYAWIKLNDDATITVITGTQDIGTGIKTALAQIAAEELGIAVTGIAVEIGDTQLMPMSAISAGSMTLASAGPAVRAAAFDLKSQIFALAADMLEAQPDYLLLENGVIYRLPGMDRSLPLADFVKRLGDAELMGKGSRLPNPEELSIQTFGAQFAEVEVDTQTGAVRVVRVVAVHESGRIINPLTVEGQINGGVIQSMGLALMEDRIVDQRSGLVLNANLESYLIPTALDIPAIEHQMVDLPTPQINNIGAKGVGEPPIIPTAGAIGNAIFHATGIRVYDLPLTPARMLAALGATEGGRGHA